MVSKEEFEAYCKIQDSGVTNMFYITDVCRFSGGILSKDVCIDIMENYSKYQEMYKIIPLEEENLNG